MQPVSADIAINNVRSARRKRQYPVALKLQVVKETMARGASVSVVAQRHNINSNVVFRWRKEYRVGELRDDMAEAFLPVRLVPDAPALLTAPSAPSIPAPPATLRQAETPGTIELNLPGGFMLRIGGDADDAMLRRVLRAVRDLS